MAGRYDSNPFDDDDVNSFYARGRKMQQNDEGQDSVPGRRQLIGLLEFHRVPNKKSLELTLDELQKWVDNSFLFISSSMNDDVVDGIWGFPAIELLKCNRVTVVGEC